MNTVDLKVKLADLVLFSLTTSALVYWSFGEGKADILIDSNNSAGQAQTVTAPGDHVQTIDLIDGSGFAVQINSDNGTNGTFRINPGVAVTDTSSTAVWLRPGAVLSYFDVQGTLISTQYNAININSIAAVETLSNSGTIQAQRTGAATLYAPGYITTFNNTGVIEHTAGSTALVTDNVTALTNGASGSIISAGGMGIRFGYASPGTIGLFTNNGLVSGGTVAIELGNQAGSTAGITNRGTITGGQDGLLILNGSELSSFDNTGGVIESTGADGAGLRLREDQDIAITNGGLIRNTSTGYGLRLDTEGQTRDFTNNGTISSTAGTAIFAEAAMTGHDHGLVNIGIIFGGGGIAVDARDTFRLANNGSITGSISHSVAGALTIIQTSGSITGNITSTVDAAHSIEFAGGTVSGNIMLDGTTANTFALSGADITGDVDLGDGAAHAVTLSSGAIRGTLDIGSETTELLIDVAGGDTVTVGALATNGTTTTTINGPGDVEVATFTVNGTANQSAGILRATDLTVGNGGSFTQSGTSILDASNVGLDGSAILNLNGTGARVTGPIEGGVDSRVFVNGTFTSEDTINVGHFEIADGGVFNMAHDVTVTSPTTFANFGRLTVDAGNTVTITGNYTQAPNAVFQTDVANDTSFGKLVVTGTADLPSNARIDVNVADANFNFTVDEMQDIISAGTLTSDGTFIVTDNSNLFDFEALVSGDTVDLCLAAAGGSCTAGASVGVYEAVVAMGNWPGVGAAVVFDDLIDTFVTAGTSGNGDMDDVIGALGALGTQQEVSNAVSQTLPLLSASAAIPIENTLSTTRRIVQSRLDDGGWRPLADGALAHKYIWANGFHTRTDQGDRNAVTGFDGASTGLVIGADGNIDVATSLGIAFAYSDTNVDSNTDLNSADIETYQVIGYGRYALNASTNVNFQVGVGFSETDGQRTISFVDGVPVARSNYGSTNFHLGGGIGRTIELGDALQLGTSMRIDYLHLNSEQYTETGAGALSLDISANQLDVLELGLSGKMRYDFNEAVSLIASLGVAYDAFNEQPALTGSFVGGGDAFVTRGINPSPWIGRVGFDVPIALSDDAHIAMHYDLEARQGYTNQTAFMKFQWKL